VVNGASTHDGNELVIGNRKRKKGARGNGGLHSPAFPPTLPPRIPAMMVQMTLACPHPDIVWPGLPFVFSSSSPPFLSLPPSFSLYISSPSAVTGSTSVRVSRVRFLILSRRYERL
jgi:hypothetical protein